MHAHAFYITEEGNSLTMDHFRRPTLYILRCLLCRSTAVARWLAESTKSRQWWKVANWWRCVSSLALSKKKTKFLKNQKRTSTIRKDLALFWYSTGLRVLNVIVSGSDLFDYISKSQIIDRTIAGGARQAYWGIFRTWLLAGRTRQEIFWRAYRRFSEKVDGCKIGMSYRTLGLL